MWLISHGETSIETHINTKEKQKAAKRGMVHLFSYSLINFDCLFYHCLLQFKMISL